MKRLGYLSIREAAVQYEVSRAKLHRLIQVGRLEGRKDPRDERVTLLRTEDLEEVFRFPMEEAGAVEYKLDYAKERPDMGTLTADLRARADAVRARVEGGGELRYDSAELVREERERRTRDTDESLSGT